MKRIISILCAFTLLFQLAAIPVFAGDEPVKYEAPESPAVTYNMNLDWKFYDCRTNSEIWTAMAAADKNGKKFYEKDYDDSDWESVSIPHGIGGGTNSFAGIQGDNGGGYRSVLLYRKTITVPDYQAGSKVFFELEGIRQSAYLWVNGQQVGYYEAGITAMGFDITNYLENGKAVIAICNDGWTTKGNSNRTPYETVPGEKWGSSYTPNNGSSRVGGGAGYQWNTMDFNEPQIGLVYDAYLHVKNSVYQTLPLYNNLKTTGNYIYADNFSIKDKTATIHVDAEVRNESGASGDYTLEVNIVDADGNLKYNFTSNKTTVAAAGDAGAAYTTAVENDVYDAKNLDEYYLLDATKVADQFLDASKRPAYSDDDYRITYADKLGDPVKVTDKSALPDYGTPNADGKMLKYYTDSSCKTETRDKNQAEYYKVWDIEADVHREVGVTKVNTVDVTHIIASYDAEDLRFWSTEDPYLYTVYTVLRDANGKAVDVQKKDTGFRKVTFDKNNGVMLNDKGVWLRGYAQRSTNEWAVIGVANDWLNDYDMKLFKENNANFIRWMHVAPKPYEVRSTDRYGIAIAAPAGDKEGSVCGRQWSQRTEAMRDTMIYFRNSPSVIFWESGNSAVGLDVKADEMAALRDEIDPKGMRFIGARSTTSKSEMNYQYNYAGTMYGNHGATANAAMQENGIMGPIMETEYARGESPRRVWDDYSPPDYDYVNKYLGPNGKKTDGYDIWDATQEDMAISNVREYNGYYKNRNGAGDSLFSAEAMMVWSDSNMHTRNAGTENCRTSGRVDPIRQTKEMYNALTAAQSQTSALDIIGHWSYPEYTDTSDNYYYYEKKSNGTYEVYDKTKKKRRDPTKKTVYVVASADVTKVELYRVDGGTETLIGEDTTAEDSFIYSFENVDVTKGDAVIAKAYNSRGEELEDARDEIERTYNAVSVKLTPHTAVKAGENGESVSDWRADGSDIAYFDVEVVDKNGNVCALNYDRIDFRFTGEGTFLGGYNGGSGAGAFQNTSATDGISFYFGGVKDGVSTLGKNYVYAENGTNRVFVRSTRNAGTFTLTASMDGIPGTSVSITSDPVEMVGNSGLTLSEQSVLKPGTKDAPNYSTALPMKPLMFSKKAIVWSDVKTVVQEDTNVYYDTYVNDELLTLTAKTRLGNMNTLFAPVAEIMDAVKAAGKTDFSYSYNASASPASLSINSPDGSVYTYYNGVNQMQKDDDPMWSETVEAATIENGVMIANLTMMFDAIGLPNASYVIDSANKTVKITVTPNVSAN